MALALSGDSPAEPARAAVGGETARNVIFLHGDGMSVAAREAIRLATVGPNDNLVMNQLEAGGLLETEPDDPEEIVTDSAAGEASVTCAVVTSPVAFPAARACSRTVGTERPSASTPIAPL